VPRRGQVVADVAQVGVRRNPIPAVVSGQVDREAIGPEGPAAQGVDEDVEIGHDQLPNRPINGFPEAEPRKIGLGDGAPAIIFLEDGDDVVVVVLGGHVHDQRLAAEGAQGRGREKGAFEAVGLFLPGDPERGAGSDLGIVIEPVERFLDPDRGIQAAEKD